MARKTKEVIPDPHYFPDHPICKEHPVENYNPEKLRVIDSAIRSWLIEIMDIALDEIGFKHTQSNATERVWSKERLQFAFNFSNIPRDDDRRGTIIQDAHEFSTLRECCLIENRNEGEAYAFLRGLTVGQIFKSAHSAKKREAHTKREQSKNRKKGNARNLQNITLSQQVIGEIIEILEAHHKKGFDIQNASCKDLENEIKRQHEHFQSRGLIKNIRMNNGSMLYEFKGKPRERVLIELHKGVRRKLKNKS